MSDQSVTRNLFDDGAGLALKANMTWSPVAWDSTTSRHDEQGDRTVTRKPMRRSSPRFGKSGRNIRVAVYDHSFEGNRAWFRFAFKMA